MPVTETIAGRWMPTCDVPGCGWQPRHGSRDEARARRYLARHLSEQHRGRLEAIVDAAFTILDTWRREGEGPTLRDDLRRLEEVARS